MTIQQEQRARFTELAIGDAFADLSAEEAAEYAALRTHGMGTDVSESVRAVAAALQASLGELEPMPRDLAARVEREGYRHLERLPRTLPVAPRRRSAPSMRFAYGGWLAAAASVLVALYAWRMQPGGAPQLTVAASVERTSLLVSGRPLIRANWSSGGDTTGLAVHGDVVWDPARQTGYLRFTGLARNNPSLEQYQLWIFDKARDQRYPVDGGTFDVTASGEVVVRIRARLRIDAPTLFAVTVERPGGVVVSSRARMAAVAQTG